MILLIAKLAICLTALLHVLFFKLESIDFIKAKAFIKFGVRSTEDAEKVKFWAFNQGFYNLFLALGLFFSLVLFYSNRSVEGRTLAQFICASLVGAGGVLVISVPKKWPAGLLQAGPPLLAFICLLFV